VAVADKEIIHRVQQQRGRVAIIMKIETARKLVRSVAFAGLGVGLLALTPVGAARAETSPTVAAVLQFDKIGAKPAKQYRIGYLAECVQNPYCQERLTGIQDAAKKYGFTFKLFDANFNPASQLKQVQDAVAEGFDAYLFAPTASAPACSMWKRYLVPTGKPVVTLDLPMCGDANYTSGLAATVSMQRQVYFDAHVNNAFASCKEPCEAAAIGGFVGSDLFNFWETAIKRAAVKYPNVKVVLDQPGNFDPATALRVMQDGLRAHPKIKIVLSPWDDMTRGIAQAIHNNGEQPGKDVRIYSLGATKDGIKKVEDGIYTEVTVLLPWEESYYAGVAAVMALEGHAPNGYINEAELPRVADGPGTIFITKANVAKFKPNY
jgi:ABC-type sugar transport system substrate-binding protein